MKMEADIIRESAMRLETLFTWQLLKNIEILNEIYCMALISGVSLFSELLVVEPNYKGRIAEKIA
jgi:hypothetical protein